MKTHHVAFALIVTLVLLPSAAQAQNESIEAAVVRLGGRAVSVVDGDGRETRGTVLGLEGESVTLRIGDVRHAVPVSAIRRIEQRGDSPWNGPLVGASLGAGLSVAWWWIELRCSGDACGDDPTPHLSMAKAARLTAGAAMAGLVIDLVHQKRTIVWIAPVLEPDRAQGPGAGAVRSAPAIMFGYKRTF